MITRREFLSRSARGVAWMGLGGSVGGVWPRRAFAADGRVTILHTNDVHSSLLLDAGDVFQGTPYFNLFHGELDFKVMRRLGYDAMTIGNHDFDAGLEGLAAAARHADFELLSANYDFSGTLLADRVKPSMIRRVGRAKVGIFGLGVVLKGLVPEKLCAGVTYADPLETARRESARLRHDEKCDLVICLAHLGVDGYHGEPGERDIGRQVGDIDLVIGGHSHTFMDQPDRFQHDGRETLVFQVGWGGINLGRVDFDLAEGRVASARACTIPIGHSTGETVSPTEVPRVV